MNLRLAFIVVVAGLLGACTGNHNMIVEGGRFPVPLMDKAPVRLGVYLDDEIRSYVHTETRDKKSEWTVDVGGAQLDLFSNLAEGVFQDHELVDSSAAGHLDGVLKPSIKEIQFSLPKQTRTNYYEVWIRYHFQLFDKEGNPVGEWTLPAYGKANTNDHGSTTVGLQEAALAACRDAMAFFSINFVREPVVRNWLAAGKPVVPPAPPVNTPAPSPADPQAPAVTSTEGSQT